MTAATLTPTELTGRVAKITWQADDGSAVIGRLDDGATIKGPCDPDAPVAAGLTYRFSGGWHQHERYGKQFQFASYHKIVPHDRRGVLAYLTTTVDGVGERTALKLWEAFGGEAVQVLREDPARVAAAGVMSMKRATEAALELHNEAAFETVKVDLLSLFAGRGFQAAKLIRQCIQAWGERSPYLIARNPYLLMVRGMISAGFKRCDKLYLDRGGKPARLKRQTLCAWHALRTDSSGHTWHQARYAGDAVEKAMPLGRARPVDALRLGVRAAWLARRKDGAGGVWVAERGKARNEETVAREVMRLSRGTGGERP